MPMRRTIAVLPALALAAAAVAASAVYAGDLALIASDGDGRVLFARPIEIGDSFAIMFIHSVARTPVEEIFCVTAPDEFTLRETVYRDFGAGLPHEESAGRRMEFGNGVIRLTGYDVKFAELRLRVGYIAEHAIVFKDGTAARLADYQRRGGEVRLSVGKTD